MKEYTTISGDTFDKVALQVYGNELYADLLMEANGYALCYLVFPAGLRLALPAPEKRKTSGGDAAEWREILNA